MSTETHDRSGRGLIDRIRASPFLSDLLSNRLALLGLAIIVSLVAVGVVARFTFDYGALTDVAYDTNPKYQSPGGEFLFGTDKLARDIFTRTLYGAWLALKYGTITVGASTVFGVTLGVLAAYYGDVADNVIMRTMDVLLAFPPLLLALALIAVFSGGSSSGSMLVAVGALTLVYTPRFARVVRGAALKVLEDEYVEATEALGARDPRVLVRHVLPNCLAPITVQSTLNFGLAIIDIAALSFLGFGAAVDTPSWGIMLSEGVKKGMPIGIWWWPFFPGLFLALTVLGFNLLGDGMRDALDPRMRETVD